jgi:hypothetical protein
MIPAAVAGRFLTVPLKTAPLLVIVVFSLLLRIAIAASVLGIPLGLVLLTGFLNYAFVLLDSVIDGAAEPPVLAVEMMNPVSSQRSVSLLVFVLIVFFASRAATYWFGPWLAAAGALIGAILLPAMIAVQSITGSTLQALNLRTALRLIGRLGSDHALIIACAIAAVLTGVFLSAAVSWPLVIRIALLMYLWLAVFSLIGGVLRERSPDLDLEGAWEPTIRESSSDAQLRRTQDQLIDRIYAEWRGGAHHNALATIAAQVAAADDPLDELRWLYQRIAQWPDSRLAEQLARQLLPQLLTRRHASEALEVVRARLKVNDHFRPLTGAEVLQLASLARDAGDRPTARALLRDFEQLYPCDPALIAVSSLSKQLER